MYILLPWGSRHTSAPEGRSLTPGQCLLHASLWITMISDYRIQLGIISYHTISLSCQDLSVIHGRVASWSGRTRWDIRSWLSESATVPQCQDSETSATQQNCLSAFSISCATETNAAISYKFTVDTTDSHWVHIDKQMNQHYILQDKDIFLSLNTYDTSMYVADRFHTAKLRFVWRIIQKLKWRRLGYATLLIVGLLMHQPTVACRRSFPAELAIVKPRTSMRLRASRGFLFPLYTEYLI